MSQKNRDLSFYLPLSAVRVDWRGRVCCSYLINILDKYIYRRKIRQKIKFPLVGDLINNGTRGVTARTIAELPDLCAALAEHRTSGTSIRYDRTQIAAIGQKPYPRGEILLNMEDNR